MKRKLFIYTLPLLLVLGCINPLGNSQKETVASKVSESIANQQSLSVERSTKSSPPPSVRISVPVNNQITTPNTARNIYTNTVSGISQINDGAVHIEIPAVSEDTVKSTSEGKVASTGAISSTYNFIKDISLGGKIILIAIGLGLLYFAVNMIRKRYKSVDVLASKLDEAAAIAEEKIASRINGLREKSLQTTDPTENARISSELVRLNEDRGKLKVQINDLKE